MIGIVWCLFSPLSTRYLEIEREPPFVMKNGQLYVCEAERSEDPSTSADKTIKNYDRELILLLKILHETKKKGVSYTLHTIACSIEL